MEAMGLSLHDWKSSTEGFNVGFFRNAAILTEHKTAPRPSPSRGSFFYGSSSRRS